MTIGTSSASAVEVTGWLRNEPASQMDANSLAYFRSELQGPGHLYIWAEPIEVYEIAGQKNVLNGHHRLTVAAEVNYTGTIPYKILTEAEMLQYYNTTPFQLLQGHHGPIKP
jgi:hypothetical protein